MGSIQERLEEHGFVNDKGKADQETPTDTEFDDKGDFFDGEPSTYPRPLNRHKLVFEKMGANVEEPYYFILDHTRELRGYPRVIKVRDVFSATEGSAFFGSSAQRLGIQQDRATQYLAQIGKFMKELFQMVRELRIIDMRIKMYEDSEKGDKTADMALKGIWVDMVEGGTKNATSVLGLAREVGFTVLPDLFFGTFVKKREEVDPTIRNLRFNEKMKEVLGRKLYSYMVWREKTWKETTVRRGFMVKYLRQHWSIIMMYMNWVRPYLKHIQRLSMNQDTLDSPHMVTAFETSTLEIEVLFVSQGEKHHKAVLVSYLYRTRPGMDYQQDGYQHRGPLHQGRVEINFRSYVWTEENIQKYLEYRRQEDMELLRSIDGSLDAAMSALGGDLKAYLKEAGETFDEDEDKDEEKEEKKSLIDPKQMIRTALSPATNILNGIGEMVLGKEIVPDSNKKDKTPKVSAMSEMKESDEKNAQKKGVNTDMWLIFNIFKKGHRMLNW